MLFSTVSRALVGKQQSFFTVRWFASTSGGKNDQILPKKIERTPVGRLEETADDRKNDDQHDERAKRRIVNPETGEIGGPTGPEPTRYNDWERKGRVSDF
ncbi:Succinate dehydrogenase assembly factor 4, mitochondrial [Aphelenchoides besseyi]|nr:Succinate dehydrogenase assembly factor 4, mitochondrial [Aphelenchoides besseyi]KAI6200274.1 Succinate dehydrogenase assembly factor 4, mitochondrial [Aphelenchoides besseyi]